jgi:hypothetical protein
LLSATSRRAFSTRWPILEEECWPDGMSALPSPVPHDRWVAENDAALVRASECPRRRGRYTVPVAADRCTTRGDDGARRECGNGLGCEASPLLRRGARARYADRHCRRSCG